MLWTRRKMLKLATVASLIKPSRALAMMPHGTPPRQQPAPPAGITGLTQSLAWDDFTSLANVDVNNTSLVGPYWYLANLETWEGTSYTPHPATTPADYTQSGSDITLITNPSNAAIQGNMFSSVGIFGSGPASTVNTLPLIPGSKPFYVECNAAPTIAKQTTFWMEDYAALLRTVNNSAGSTKGAEIGVWEIHQSDALNQHLYTWVSATSYVDNFLGNPSYSSGAFSSFGIYVVPAAYNGGTGFAQFYINGSTSSSLITWTSDAYGVEASNFVMLFSIASGQSVPLPIDYISAWGHP